MKTKFNIGAIKLKVAVPKEVSGAEHDINIDFDLSNVETEVEASALELIQVMKQAASSMSAIKQIFDGAVPSYEETAEQLKQNMPPTIAQMFEDILNKSSHESGMPIFIMHKGGLSGSGPLGTGGQ